MNISEYYSLAYQQSKLDFVDIRLNTDNLLFVDPRLIEFLDTPLAKQMQKHLEIFWGELLKNVKQKSFTQADYLLSGLSEPNETRLGYAFSKDYGNSVGSKLRQRMAVTIYNNIAVKTGVLSHFADIELYFEDIGSDRISDITTKIIKSVLIDYTQEQCKIHKIPMKTFVQKDIFDIKTLKWVTRKVELPEYFGKPIIFVPKNIVRLENTAGKNVSCFYRFAIRQFVSNDTEMLKDISPTGKDGQILIRDVKSKYPLSKESLTNWTLHFGELLVDYKTDHLNGRLKTLSDDEIMEIIYDDGYSDVG
ncbi:hypothetical protein MWU65_13560 [Cellulophaga sp. F20128]|uniref:hypothetical protein n=1 Tax=Cellulophaga sp. F20128 TaxID=2926413 RepID=UPI001FF2FB09|nr:hypothetical protein [Cellulophaga sp. F20128]MCK0158216.1 hypothetical protein [Cellulophaga sp. F20128]